MVRWCVLVHCGTGGIKNYQLVEITHDQQAIELLFVLHKLEQFGQQIVPNLENMRTPDPGGDKTLGHSKVFHWERVNPQTQTQGWKLKTSTLFHWELLPPQRSLLLLLVQYGLWYSLAPTPKTHLPIKVNKQYFYYKTALEHESFILIRASVTAWTTTNHNQYNIFSNLSTSFCRLVEAVNWHTLQWC